MIELICYLVCINDFCIFNFNTYDKPIEKSVLLFNAYDLEIVKSSCSDQGKNVTTQHEILSCMPFTYHKEKRTNVDFSTRLSLV